jgi:hypothetical protein
MKMDGGTNRQKVLISRQRDERKSGSHRRNCFICRCEKKETNPSDDITSVRDTGSENTNCSCFGGRGVFANKDLFVIEELGAPEQTL